MIAVFVQLKTPGVSLMLKTNLVFFFLLRSFPSHIASVLKRRIFVDKSKKEKYLNRPTAEVFPEFLATLPVEEIWTTAREIRRMFKMQLNKQICLIIL